MHIPYQFLPAVTRGGACSILLFLCPLHLTGLEPSPITQWLHYRLVKEQDLFAEVSQASYGC